MNDPPQGIKTVRTNNHEEYTRKQVEIIPFSSIPSPHGLPISSCYVDIKLTFAKVVDPAGLEPGPLAISGAMRSESRTAELWAHQGNIPPVLTAKGKVEL